MDYEVQRCTRHCETSGRDLAPGESFYSVLIAEGAELRRHDYSVEVWQGPPQGAVGWWKSQIPDQSARRKQWAPNDVMLHFFDELGRQPDKRDMRYILSLLLVRRRVMRLEESETDEQGREMIVLYCPRRDATYKVLAATPDEARAEAIQEELAKLLE
ncbi:MAG TPA: hypothetical protein VE890_04170 [Thermoguttaceae bacterium]|nr:hypothetical protein [Thermoguttaceae bacterium]